MNKIELRIDGIKTELFEDEVISITQTIKNVKKIDTIFTDYSQDFSLPANSIENQRIFKRYENINIVGGYDNRVKHVATISMNGVLFKKGYVQINNVIIKNGIAESYSIRFIGGLSSLKGALKQNKLSSLTVLDSAENSFSVTSTSIKNLLQRDANFTSATVPNGFDLLASLISTEGGIFFDSVTHTNDTPNADYNGGTDNGLYYKNLKPSIRLNAIIRAIEDTYGITFSSDFFKNDAKPEMNNLFMYLNKEKGELKVEDDNDSYLLSNYSYLNWTSVDGASTQSSWYDITSNSAGRITVTPDTFPTIMTGCTMTITPDDTALEYQIRIYKLSTGESLIDEWRTGTSTLDFSGSTLSGDLVFRVGIEGDNNIEIELDYAITGTSNDFQLTSNAQSFETIPYSVANNLPDMTIEKFLKGLFTMFNLIAYEGASGEIVVETFVDYVASGVDTDITEYVDDTTVRVDGSYQYAGVKLSHAEAGDKNSLAEDNFQGKPFGEFSYSAVEINTGGAEYELSTPFSIIQYRRLTDDVDGSNTDIQIGEVVDSNDNSIVTKPILYYPQKLDISFALKTSASTSEEVTGVNIPTNTVELYSVDSDLTITFGVETSPYNRSRAFTGTLWSTYYNRFLSPIFNIRNRLIKVEASLPIKILTSFTLRDRFVYKNIPYRINSIKTNLQTGQSSIELLTDTVFVNEEFSVAVIGNAPVITITGSNPDTVNASGFPYSDAGATATDVEDGALSVTTIQDLTDISTVGTYYVRYRAIDSDNNVTIAKRTVIVEDTTAPAILTWTYNSRTSSTVTVNYDVSDGGTGIQSLQFWYKEVSSSDWILKNTTQGAGASTLTSTFQYKGLTSGVNYDFRVVAKDLVLNESTSGTINQSTL